MSKVEEKVRSSELETGLPSSENPIVHEVDTTSSLPPPLDSFKAMSFLCNYYLKTTKARTKDKFQIPPFVLSMPCGGERG